MRRGFGIFGVLMTLIVIGVVGFFAYQVGWSDGLAQHLPANGGQTTVVAPYYYGWGGPHFLGFGWIFGLLFSLFLLFFVFRVIAFGLFGGWRRGGWGMYDRHGWGMYGGGIPPAIDERMREWHRQAHGEAPSTPPTGGPSTPPPPPPPTQQ